MIVPLLIALQSATPGVYAPAPIEVPRPRTRQDPASEAPVQTPTVRPAPVPLPAAAQAQWRAAEARLAAGDAAGAMPHYDALIAGGQLSGTALGTAHLDRAVARQRANRPVADVASDLARARTLAPDDASTWLLSAVVERRRDALGPAGVYIGRALALAPTDAAIALEAGNIAVLTGNDVGARTQWTRAITLAPGSTEAQAATQNLERLGGGTVTAPGR